MRKPINSLILASESNRFFKLFISHLDEAFKKQSHPGLRTLVADKVESPTRAAESYAKFWTVPRRTGLWYNLRQMQ